MDNNDLDKLLYSIFNEEIAPTERLVSETKERMKRDLEIHYILGFSLILNMLIFTGILLFIALTPKGIIVKVTASVLISVFTNIIILLIVLFKDNVNNLLDAL